MSETHETPAERRLREMVKTRQSVERGRTTYDGDQWMPEHVALTNAIDAGREAIELLRVCGIGKNADARLVWEQERRALLARCGEDA